MVMNKIMKNDVKANGSGNIKACMAEENQISTIHIYIR